jgi:hypothetical protein
VTTAQDTLDGESVFIAKPETAHRLRELLGLGLMARAETAKPASAPGRAVQLPSGERGLKRRGRRVGSRRPARDEVGISRAG